MTLTVKEVQDRYGVSQATVLHWLATGQLKGINVGRDPDKKRARWRVSDAAIKAFEESRSATPTTPIRSRRRKSDDIIEFFK